MTTRYVGPGGSDANSGLTWALRKLTLNGVEDTPVVAGDTVYVGPGTYRETLTVDVSGSSGSPITYVGDYLGTNTDGAGGPVRITGSNNDSTATRANGITATAKDYRTFQNLAFDLFTAGQACLASNCDNWIIDGCAYQGLAAIEFQSTSLSATIKNCFFMSVTNYYGLYFNHTSVVDNAGHLVSNCVFLSGTGAIQISRVGGITVQNSLFFGRAVFTIVISTALTVGQTVTVNNCIFLGNNHSLDATVTGEIVENYNAFHACGVPRTNVNTGADSNTYPPLFDSRWFFELVSGRGRMMSPFDLASFSQLLNLAGTSPSTIDMRGTAVIGAQREWGPLEYDATLLTRRVIARQT
jgi:hypothetical protein